MPPSMAQGADIYAPLATGGGLLRLIGEVARFERKREGSDAIEQWIHVLPAGPVVVARDGRNFQISDLMRLTAHSELPLLIDWEHASEFGSTRAAGWVEELAIEQGKGDFPRPGVWGRAEWTDQGSADIQSRTYRFLSPTLLIDKESRDAVQILAVALTNRPALSLEGLNAYREQMSALLGPEHRGGTAMQAETKRALCTLYGLSADASDQSILDAANRAGASVEMCARLTTDLAAANTRARDAESRLSEHTATAFKASVDTTLANAAKEGRITPAQVESWRAFCMKGADAFDMFTKNVLPALPVLGDNAPPSPGPNDTRSAGNGVRGAVRSFFGYAPEQTAKAVAYIAARQREIDDDDDEGEV